MNNTNKNKIQYAKHNLLKFSDYISSIGLHYRNELIGPLLIFIALRENNINANTIKNELQLARVIEISFHEFRYKTKINFESDIESFISKLAKLQPDYPIIDFLFSMFSYDLSTVDIIELLEYSCYKSDNFDKLHLTPKEIISLMIEIVQPKATDKILDPAMRTGSFLHALYLYFGQSPIFNGIENSSFTYSIAQLFAWLMNANLNQLYQKNIFATQILPQELKFDIFLSVPPIGLMMSREIEMIRDLKEIIYPSRHIALNYLQWSYERLTPGGKGALLINTGPLFSGGIDKRIREFFIDQGALASVIMLPSKLLRYTSIHCAILVLKKPHNNQNPPNSKIRLVNAENFFLEMGRNYRIISKDNIDGILRLLNTDKLNEDLAIDVDIKTLKENDCCLVPNRYIIQDIGGIALGPISKWVPIDQIADIYRGRNLSSHEDGCEPIIRGRDISEGRLNLESLEYKKLSTSKEKIYRTTEGDILLQKIGNKPTAYCINNDEEGLAISDTVFIIRLKVRNKKYALFLTEFINSNQGNTHLTQGTHVMPIITQSISHLKKVIVPCPDNSIINLVCEMSEVETALKSEYQKATQLKSQIFGIWEAVELSSNLNEIRLTNLALQDALSKKDDIKFKIRNLYPFPIAYPYRSLYSEKEASAIYQSQMRFGEHILSFLASIGLSIIFHYKNELILDEEFSNLIKKSFERGISPGDWKELLHHSCKILLQLDSQSFATEFASIWFKGKEKKASDFAKIAETHIVSKINAHKHHRGPNSSYECEKASKEHELLLIDILKKLEFLIRAKLYLIEDVSFKWNTNDKVIKAFLLQGDHPAFELFEFISPQDFSQGLLYLDVGDKQFICLYPLLSVIFNPHTRRKEIYSFDKLDSKKIIVKSFDSCDSQKIEQLKVDFDFWLDHF